MAVAPINKVRQIVQYAVTEIPVSKISLGIPNYGYDWALPYIRGTTLAQSIGYHEALSRAYENGVPIQFDETSQSPFFEYRVNNVDHVVWFEDVRSIQAKIRLAQEFGLLGLGYWNLMRPFLPNWLLLNAMTHIVNDSIS